MTTISSAIRPILAQVRARLELARISGHILPMSETEWSLSEAKDHFSQLVAAARRGKPQTVTRHGKAAVVVLKAEDYARLEAQGQAPKKTFIQHLMDVPKGEVDLEIERIPAKARDVTF
jgi:prevent-host-death family protein